MEIKFDGKVALVTGAGKGIGRSIAEMLVTCGAKTYALSRTQSDLDSLKEEVPSINTITVDLADWDATQEAVEGIGPIDLLVNNAAILHLIPFLEIPKEQFDSLININLRAYMQVAQIAARTMVARGTGGSIVNISSLAAHNAFTDLSMYGMTKAATDMLTKSIATELGSKKIRANSVNPTVVLTPMGIKAWSDPARSDPVLKRHPMKRFAEVEDVVNAVMFLLSDKAAMINGVYLPVDGGFLAAGV